MNKLKKGGRKKNVKCSLNSEAVFNETLFFEEGCFQTQQERGSEGIHLRLFRNRKSDFRSKSNSSRHSTKALSLQDKIITAHVSDQNNKVW